MLFRSAILRERGLLTPAVEGYLDQLQRFIINRKRAIDQGELVLTERYTYDFNAINTLNYAIDPNTFPTTDPMEYTFFHDEHQKAHIEKQLRVYRNTPMGLGRLIQRSNLKMMYRRFACAPVQTVAVRVQ